MNAILIKSTFKLLLFFVLVSGIVFGIKHFCFQVLGIKSIPESIFQPKDNFKSTLYFVGSSRTKYGINDTLIERRLKNIKVVNAGVLSANFLSSTMLALEILSMDSNSTLCIELGVVNGKAPTQISMLVETRYLHSTFESNLQESSLEDLYKIYFPYYEAYFFDFFSIKPYLSYLLSNESISSLTQFGVHNKNLNLLPYHSIKCGDLNKDYAKPSHDFIIYENLIKLILEKSKISNAKVYFYLPPHTTSDEQKERLIQLFKLIPIENRINFNCEFLAALRNPMLMADEGHLNVKGASFYSFFFANFFAH